MFFIDVFFGILFGIFFDILFNILFDILFLNDQEKGSPHPPPFPYVWLISLHKSFFADYYYHYY